MADSVQASSGQANAAPAAGEEDWTIHSDRPPNASSNTWNGKTCFLVSLDDGSRRRQHGWFRYHHLFADLLQARLQQTQPNLIPRLHLRASAWLEQKGFISEAVQHLLAAPEVDRAADLIERYGPARWADSDLSVLQMADSLPREMLIERPKIGIYQAWLFINQGMIEKAYPLLTDLAQTF